MLKREHHPTQTEENSDDEDYQSQKHSGRRTFKMTMALERSSFKGGAVRRRQCENQPMRKKVWAMSKPEEVSAPA
jgi:hypothetical protein